VRDKPVHTVLFAAAFCGFCSLLATLVASVAEERRVENRKADRLRHLLQVLEADVPSEASPRELLAVFEQDVSVVGLGGGSVYRHAADGAVAVAFDGAGLWGRIRGFIAFEPDLVTVRGITFYEQNETPGLGGEIAAGCTCAAVSARCPAWFRHQFEGWRLRDVDGGFGVRIVSGNARRAAANELDGITGATMTCERVERMVNRAVQVVLGGGVRCPGQVGHETEKRARRPSSESG